MKRADKFTLFHDGRPAAYPCDACGGKKRIWCEFPFPGHNSATLYECMDCGAVFTLSDIVGGDVSWLP